MKVLATPAAYTLSDRVGTEPYISYALLYFLSKDYNVKYFAITNRAELDTFLPSNIKNIEAHVNFSGDQLIENIAFVLKYAKLSIDVLKKENISLIHHILPSGTGFNPLSLIGLTRKYPFIMGPVQCPQTITFPDEDLLGGRASWSILRKANIFSSILREIILKLGSPIINRLAEQTLTDCDTLIAVNNAAKKLYSKYISINKIKVVPFGVEIKRFNFSTPPPNKNILAIGGLFRRKGFDQLIKAMPIIQREFPDVKLQIVGSGPQMYNLKNLANKLGVNPNVVFHGFVHLKNVPKFFNRCNLMCLPSLSESFGRVIIEAMASGRPVVATRTIGAKEIVEHGRTGLLIPIGDATSLAEALLKMLGNPELLNKMSYEARRIVEKKYDWRIIAEKYYEIYEKTSL
jgi:glycosyltransferase involved in cell wall biosynthesis